jgi:hypothetical protein
MASNHSTALKAQTSTLDGKVQQLKNTDEFSADLEDVEDIKQFYQNICLNGSDQDLGKLKSMSRKFSNMHSELVKMEYKY